MFIILIIIQEIYEIAADGQYFSITYWNIFYLLFIDYQSNILGRIDGDFSGLMKMKDFMNYDGKIFHYFKSYLQT